MKTKVHRNDPCPCGSGKKYKKCCYNSFRSSSNKEFKFIREISEYEKRMIKLAISVPPPEGSSIREAMEQEILQLQQDPAYEKFMKNNFKKACSIALIQNDNGIGFEMDKLIREFVFEYNRRNFEYGLKSMPASFNVLEAFIDYDPLLSIFKLRDEKEHLVSFTEFLDYVTSVNATDDINLVLDYIDERIIYSYNLLNNPEDITFSLANGVEFVIGGASLIRYGKEVNIILLAGEKNDLISKTQELQEIAIDPKRPPGKESINPAEDEKREAIPLMGNNELWRSIALTRFDFNDMTQSIRYFLQDIGDNYTIITDDIEALIMSENDLSDPKFQKYATEISEQIQNYQILFEICKTVLHLPLYFDYYSNLIIEEPHPTSLFNKSLEQIKNKYPFVDRKLATKSRSVSVIRKNIETPPDTSFYKAPGFNVDVSGFWRKLPQDCLGEDKYGRPIHGRTWVRKTLTWIESQIEPDAIQVKFHKSHTTTKKSKPNSDDGYIYVMRSAAHSKDIFKVGFTRRNVDIRSDEISRTTGSPDKFLVVQEWYVSDCIKAEKLIHESLKNYRINPKREFFKVEYKIIFKIIHDIITEINKQ